MKMNCRLTTFIAIFVLFPLIISGTAFGVTISLVTYGDGDTTERTGFAPGEFVYLDIKADDPSGIAGAAFTLEINDPDAVLIKPTSTDGVPDASSDTNITSAFPFTFEYPAGTDNDMFRTNAGETGDPALIYFSGATIDSSTGGARTVTSEALFTVKFRIKGTASVGSTFNFTLKQTELFNLAAGYGIDDGNGVYDEGIDTKETVPILVGAEPSSNTAVFNDFDCSDGTCAFPVLLASFDTNPTASGEISPCTPSAVSGTASYSGHQTGSLKVAAFDPNDTNFDAPIGGMTYNWDGGATSQAFNLSLCDGTYVIAAYIDTEPDDVIDTFEAQGAHGTQITVSGSAVSGINFSLTDPDSNGDGLPDYWVALYPGIGAAGDDDDADGYSNLDEFQNETDPTAQSDPFGEGYDAASDNRQPYQLVTASPQSKKGGAGSSFTLDVQYQPTTGDGTTPDDTLTGLGVRIHYDSTKLTWNSFSNVLQTSIFAQDDTPQDDTVNDFDNDPSTDKFLTVAWTDFSGNWPGAGTSFPLTLFTVSFTADEGLVDGDTSSINFSSSSTAAGFTFFGKAVPFEISPFNLDIDANGTPDALTDGVLIVRYLFGFRDSVLTNGALAPEAIRTVADDIEAYIEDGKSALDVDGNGTPDALTDGVLIVRYLFGFRDSVLISGALAPDATRMAADDIEVYIEGLKP